MATHLFIAPAATGKTTYVLTRARTVAQGLTAVPRVVVPTQVPVNTPVKIGTTSFEPRR